MEDKSHVMRFNDDRYLVKQGPLTMAPCWAMNSAGPGSPLNKCFLKTSPKALAEECGARIMVKKGKTILAHQECFFDYGEGHTLPACSTLPKAITVKPPALTGVPVRTHMSCACACACAGRRVRAPLDLGVVLGSRLWSYGCRWAEERVPHMSRVADCLLCGPARTQLTRKRPNYRCSTRRCTRSLRRA